MLFNPGRGGGLKRLLAGSAEGMATTSGLRRAIVRGDVEALASAVHADRPLPPLYFVLAASSTEEQDHYAVTYLLKVRTNGFMVVLPDTGRVRDYVGVARELRGRGSGFPIVPRGPCCRRHALRPHMLDWANRWLDRLEPKSIGRELRSSKTVWRSRARRLPMVHRWRSRGLNDADLGWFGVSANRGRGAYCCSLKRSLEPCRLHTGPGPGPGAGGLQHHHSGFAAGTNEAKRHPPWQAARRETGCRMRWRAARAAEATAPEETVSQRVQSNALTELGLSQAEPGLMREYIELWCSAHLPDFDPQCTDPIDP